MSEKIFKVASGDEIIVRVPKSKDSILPSSLLPRGKGMIRTRRDDDILPRRLQKAGLINFYDLGQILISGVWRDLDFAIEAGFSSLESIVDFSLIESNVVRPAQSEIAALDTKIFEVAITDWTTAYRKLDFENAYKYNALVRINNSTTLSKLDSTNAAWTSGGLKAQSVNRIAFQTNGGTPNYTFLPFDTGDADKIKITGSFDYNAPSVSFAGSTEMDVFLLPSLAFQALYLAQSGGDKYALYLNFRSLPRERFLDDLQFVNNLPVRFDEGAETFNDWADYYKSLDFAKTLKIPASGGAEILDAEDFPAAESSDIKDYRFRPAFYYTGDVGHRLNQFFAGKLLAIIKSPSKTFYVWSKVENVQFD